MQYVGMKCFVLSPKNEKTATPRCGGWHTRGGCWGWIKNGCYLMSVNMIPSVFVDFASYQPLSYSNSWIQRTR